MPSLTTYKLLKQEHEARRGEFKTVHGTVQWLLPVLSRAAFRPMTLRRSVRR